jgi:hypothetical protein
MTKLFQSRLQNARPPVLDWISLVVSLGAIAWVSFRPIGG